MEETVEQGTVIQKEITKIFINSKDAMTMMEINQFKGHTGGAFHGIFVSTGRAKTAVTSKRNEFEFSAMSAGVHAPSKRRITTVDHPIDIFHLSISGMKSIFNFFIIVSKNFLSYIHKIIMRERDTKRNP